MAFDWKEKVGWISSGFSMLLSDYCLISTDVLPVEVYNQHTLISPQYSTTGKEDL